MSENDSGVAATFLIGTESSPPPFGEEADLYAEAIKSEIIYNIERLTRENTEAFPTSIVARELKPGSVGMTVVKVRDSSYGMDEAQSDLGEIVDLFENIGYRVNNTHLEEGDYFK